VLLATIVLVIGLIFGAAPASQLPGTWPGFSADEGIFLVTQADNGSTAVFFIAQNQRHSITSADMQQELLLNPLRPVHSSTKDDVLRYVEGAPIGSAPVGLVQAAPAQVASEESLLADDSEAPSGPTEDTLYVLQPGDNLTRVSARFGVDQSTLMAVNGIANANRIYAGLTLVIPGAGSVPTATAQAEPAVVADAEVAEESTATADTYVVQPGDSAFKIAQRFGVAQSALLEANGITNPNRVYAGQTLQIPSDS
jgi:LysM repeat protein